MTARDARSIDPMELFGRFARVLLPDRDDIERFVEPARGRRGAATAVVVPADVDALRAVVATAVSAGVQLLPQGANTGLVSASVPAADRPIVIVSTDRLGAIDLDVAARTAHVGAGVRLSELNAAAAPHGLHLAVDLAADPAIGGMIATNTGGSRVLRYGPMRQQLLAAEVVAADDDASLVGSPHGLRKDSRGIDPVQLAVGSGGTLGVIAAATVALRPLPPATATWWLAVAPDVDPLAIYGLLDQRRPSTLSAFEYVSAAALGHTIDAGHLNPFGDGIPAIALLVEWSGDEVALDDLEADVAAAFDAGLVTDGRLVEPAAGWRLRHDVTESLRRLGTVAGHDVSAPLSAVMTVRDHTTELVAELAPDAELCEFGHVADGGLHLNVLFPADGQPPTTELRRRLREGIDDIVDAAGGSFSAEHGLGPLNAERWLAAASPIEKRVVAALKDVVDPHRILGHPAHPYNQLG